MAKFNNRDEMAVAINEWILNSSSELDVGVGNNKIMFMDRKSGIWLTINIAVVHHQYDDWEIEMDVETMEPDESEVIWASTVSA